MKLCNQCNTPYQPADAKQLYCGTKCKDAHKYIASKANGVNDNRLAHKRAVYIPRPPREPKPDKGCTRTECTGSHKARGLCGKHYHQWARANGMGKSPSDGWNDNRRSHHQRRNAVIRGASSAELIQISRVFTRDLWLCGLCQQQVDPALKYPHPLSASLDHVLPLIHGGAHTPQNVQCAHLRCNLVKGDRISVLSR